jgi:hypothetical protein
MVAHQDPGVHPPPVALADLSQPEQETLPVFIRLKNRLATIPAGQQVVNRTRILPTQRSWRGPSKDESKDILRPILLNCDTWPLL